MASGTTRTVNTLAWKAGKEYEMKKQYIYIVTFEIHRCCQIRSYVYHCLASNAKEACMEAKKHWRYDGGHQFHVHAVKARTQDETLLKVRTYANVEISGICLIGTYNMTDCKTWRYKASNGRYVYPLSGGIY